MKNFSLILVFVLIIGSLPGPAFPSEQPGQTAYQKLREGDGLAREQKIDEAIQTYRDAADLYQQALEEEPDNRSFQTNYRYCLGKTGYLPLQKAQEFEKNRDYPQATRFYDQAIQAYEQALERLPEDPNFLQNLDYCRHHRSQTRFQTLLNTRGKAPPFQLEKIKNGSISLQSLKGQVVLLNFVTGWCPSSQNSLEMLESVSGKYQKRGLQVVIVSVDRIEGWRKTGGEETTVKNARKYPYLFLWGTDQIYRDYGFFSSVPCLLILDREGNLHRQISSDHRTPESISREIEKIL